VEDRRRFLDLKRFQTPECVRSGFGDLPDGTVRAQQLREFDPLQIVFDVAPGIGAGLLGDALEEQRQDGERGVVVDAGWGPVIDGTELRAAPQGAPRDLDALQVLVAEREIGGTQGVIVAVDDELAIELLEDGHVLGVDARLAGLGKSQVTAVASCGAQLSDALGMHTISLLGE